MRKTLAQQYREALQQPRPLPTRPLATGEWYGVRERGRLTAIFDRLPDAELWATTDFEGRMIRSTVEIVDVQVKEGGA